MSVSESKFTLYSYWRSSCSWRVRVVLALKGIDYEYVALPLLQKKQNSEEYSKMNPMQEIPTLVISTPGKEDIVLNQSLAIIEYLEALVPTPSVYSSDALIRAQINMLALDISAGIQPIQNLKVLQKVEEISNASEKTAWAKYWVEKGLQSLEQKASKIAAGGSTHKFLVTDYPSVADACLIPQLYNARRFNIDMSQFPRLVQVEEECAKLDAFKKAHPDTQPDANQV